MAKYDNPFSQIEEVTQEEVNRQGGGVFFTGNGNYTVKIARAKDIPAAESKKEEHASIFEVDILESDNEKYPAGMKGVSIVLKDAGKQKFFYWKEMKALLMAAFNTTDVTDIDAPLCALVFDEKKQAATGKVLRVQCRDKTNEETGKVFTGRKYFPAQISAVEKKNKSA